MTSNQNVALGEKGRLHISLVVHFAIQASRKLPCIPRCA
jgi:hypothetical protein